MPEDEDEDYEDDGGDEMVDMEDDEAQLENDQLLANKNDDEDKGEDGHDENS